MPITVMAVGRISLRRLFLFGRYSLALLLPKKWLKLLEAKRGTTVELELDKKRRRIIVRFTGENTSSAGKSADQAAKPRSKGANNQSNSDLEPIPQIKD